MIDRWKAWQLLSVNLANILTYLIVLTSNLSIVFYSDTDDWTDRPDGVESSGTRERARELRSLEKTNAR